MLRLRREARSKIDRLDKTDDYVSRELEVDDDRETHEGSEPSLGSSHGPSIEVVGRGGAAYIAGINLENDDAYREEDDPAEDDLCARSNSI